MRLWLYALLAFALAARLVVACTEGDIDYTGKTCGATCPGGLTCIDGYCAKVDTLVYVTNFHVAWATPNSIRWAWTLQGQGTNLVSYELVLSSPVPDAAGAKTWTSADNEELGGYQIKGSMGFDVVSGTITSELDPSTEYDAVLQLTDINGATFQTHSVRAVTDTPRTARMVMFNGAPPSNGRYLYPPLTYESTGCGLDGGPCLAFEAGAVPPSSLNLRIAGLDLAPDRSLSDKLFQSAYVEFWVRGIGTPGSNWSESFFQMLAPDGASCSDFATCIYDCPVQWIYHPDPSGPGRYRRVQIPLSQFALRGDAGYPMPDAALTYETLLGSVIDTFSVQCPYGSDAKGTFLDQMAVFW